MWGLLSVCFLEFKCSLLAVSSLLKSFFFFFLHIGLTKTLGSLTAPLSGFF